MILTKRPETMPSHKGEIAFPGGKHDPSVDPDLRATALREAHEEIGLDPDAVEIVARLLAATFGGGEGAAGHPAPEERAAGPFPGTR